MNQYPIAYLNSNDGSGLLSFGEGERFILNEGESIEGLQQFIDAHSNSYLFIYLSYDLKNELHGLRSNNEDRICFPQAIVWAPHYVINLKKENIEFLQGEKCSESLDFVNQFLEEETDKNFHQNDFAFKPRISKEEYIQKVIEIKTHIQQGNIYELNFCQEFYAEDVEIKYVLDTYFKLNNITQAPFSSFLQLDNFSVFCGSPERFMKKKGQKITSQPIKGTAARGKTPEQDEALKTALKNNPKERAENVMIVDLVRNDLSRIAEKNSVNVEELCELYTFETVHQMISTISCQLREGTNFIDILKAMFPMGSMTGAPKLRAMELIDQFESFKRGLYSGAIGYISPNGDFDFNVVIRSLLYNKNERYLSCSVGGAITIQSDPEEEYNECLIKVERILKGING